MLQKTLLRMLSDEIKLKLMKNKYAEWKQKFKTLTKMMKVRDERRTLDNGPGKNLSTLWEEVYTEHLKFKHPDAFAKEIIKINEYYVLICWNLGSTCCLKNALLYSFGYFSKREFCKFFGYFIQICSIFLY